VDEAPLWQPSAERVRQATLSRYLAWLAGRRGLRFDSYDALWRWSTTDQEAFWSSIWEFFEVRASRPYSHVLGRGEMPGAEWFCGSELNFAEHVVDDRRSDADAIVETNEAGDVRTLSRAELRAQVAAAAAGLRRLGVGRGDRVVAYLPNVVETVVAFLACASLGAIWSSCSPDFGARSVVDRFAQIEPTVLLAADGYRYGGRVFDRRDVVAGLIAAMPTLRHAVLVSRLDAATDPPVVGATIRWEDLVASGDVEDLHFEQVPFDHPLWVLYSSGTTGLPKAIVQGHGGILVEHLKKMSLQFDLREDDRFFWFTTTGWMMWNVLVCGLLTGAAIVLYDGSSAHPDRDALWRLAERTGVTCFGTSAGFLVSCMKAGLEPGRDHDLSRVRTIGSTASPLPPEAFRWVYEHVARDVWLFSTSGGTDVCSAFVGGCPLLPVFEGELQCRSLGVAVEAWDPKGLPVVEDVGELVVTRPMPSMPLCFWNDPGGDRYRESYFSTYPGVWRHGDWIRITRRGSAVISGRSDSTINRQGVRMGTSEIYRAVTSLPDVLEGLVVDLPGAGGDGLMPLFVVLRDGAELTDALRDEIRDRIREQCSPRHVPDRILQVAEVPRTISGKVLEVPVKRILMGMPPERAASVDSMANPRSLDYFVELAATLLAEGGDGSPSTSG
jgi:acetoacetyl-CoA synthetase